MVSKELFEDPSIFYISMNIASLLKPSALDVSVSTQSGNTITVRVTSPEEGRFLSEYSIKTARQRKDAWNLPDPLDLTHVDRIVVDSEKKARKEIQRFIKINSAGAKDLKAVTYMGQFEQVAINYLLGISSNPFRHRFYDVDSLLINHGVEDVFRDDLCDTLGVFSDRDKDLWQYSSLSKVSFVRNLWQYLTNSNNFDQLDELRQVSPLELGRRIYADLKFAGFSPQGVVIQGGFLDDAGRGLHRNRKVAPLTKITDYVAEFYSEYYDPSIKTYLWEQSADFLGDIRNFSSDGAQDDLPTMVTSFGGFDRVKLFWEYNTHLPLSFEPYVGTSFFSNRVYDVETLALYLRHKNPNLAEKVDKKFTPVHEANALKASERIKEMDEFFKNNPIYTL